MSRDEMIQFMKDNPNVKITHELFSSEEYLIMKDDGNVYDENNYLFEDWETDKNGIRMRKGGSWESNWFVKCDSESYNRAYQINPCRECMSCEF